MKPRIFISTVSSELGTVRQLTANVLQGLGYDPVWQDIFGTEPGDLKKVLRDKIDGCEGLIQIVGKAYGMEPPEPDPEFGRVSYTQYEFLHARKRGKKTWVLFADDGCSHDKPLDQLDLPRDPDHPDPTGYQAERRALQEAWRQRLRQDGHLRHGVSNNTELELKLVRLKSEFDELRRGFRRWQRVVLGVGVAGLVLMACIFAAQWWSKRATEEGIAQIKTQVEEVSKAQTITLDRVRGHLRDASEQALRRSLDEAEKAPLFDDREKLREAAQKAHESRMSRIDDLAADFVALGRQEDTSPVLREMLRILNTKEETHAVEKAIDYLSSQIEAILKRVDARIQPEQQKNRLELQPVLEAARLAQTNGQPDKARKYYESVLKREPAWPQALNPYIYYLTDRSSETLAHGSLRVAQEDAEHALSLATKLISLDETSPDAQRVLAAAMGQSGDSLIIRGQNGDAELAIKHYSRSLELSEDILKRNPKSDQAARDVSISLDRLGDILRNRGQNGDSELALKHFSRLATTLQELEPKTEINLYNAACGYALCAGLLSNQPPDNAKERQKYIDLAFACLREAIRAGYKNFAHMRTDKALTILHDLPEFEQLFPKAESK